MPMLIIWPFDDEMLVPTHFITFVAWVMLVVKSGGHFHLLGLRDHDEFCSWLDG